MSCIGGADVQCSGGTVLRTDNGVGLLQSGVQVYARSTSDINVPVADPTTAFGLQPATGGSAELRVAKAADGTISSPVVILRDLGISWDKKVERPPIVETFRPLQGRTLLDASGAISYTALQPSSNLAFYDYASKGTAATQANYANNQYFPRTEPPRCPAGVSPCPTVETTGLQFTQGDWLTGGVTPTEGAVSRLHDDGDVHAGNGPNDANGNPTILPGGSGFGAPFPGSKGYRQLINWGYRYANLAYWKTQDTISIVEWTGGPGAEERSSSRDGLSAFGAVTDPATLPATGSATYGGTVYGWYAPNAGTAQQFFTGTAQITVNFATRQVNIALQNTRANTTGTPTVPVALTATVAMPAAGSSEANVLNGSATNGTLTGGIGARWFGPVANGGAPEVGGTFTLSGSGAVAIGGFLARKQ